MELRLLHRELGCTIILVTHDQEEALSMADRVALLNEGRLCQVGTPAELYRRPADAFVADFIGRTNFLPLDGGSPPRVTGFVTGLGDTLAEDSDAPAPGRVLGIRPEHIDLLAADEGGEPCRVIEAAFGGAAQSVLVEAGGHRITVEAPARARLWSAGESASLRFHAHSGRIFSSPDQSSKQSSNQSPSSAPALSPSGSQ
jgi:putative spermidine/putrescine transport system ATP-binding protein